MRNTVAFYTLGCKVNQYESEAIAREFEKRGYTVVEFDKRADVYVINTCTVTGMSDRKSRQAIRKAKRLNPAGIVVVTGCYPQVYPDDIEEIEDADIVSGIAEKTKIPDYVKQIEGGSPKIFNVKDFKENIIFEEMKVSRFSERTRAYIKIQDGCRQYCSYCIIPYARGPVRSRLPQNIFSEAKELVKNGYREIILTGIHIASYGIDLKDASLFSVLKELDTFEGLDRLRLGSLEPGFVDERFINECRKLKKLCSHFHISLQSGCDETLKRMNRKYTTALYKKMMEGLMANIDDVAVTTDIMTGFPGEDEAEHAATVSFLNEIPLAGMHVFRYSPRKGTPAASFKNQVTSDVKERRSNELIMLAREKTKKFNVKYLGQEMKVLFEQEFKEKEGYMEGRTQNNIRVVCRAGKEYAGEICNVLLAEAHDDYMTGRLN